MPIQHLRNGCFVSTLRLNLSKEITNNVKIYNKFKVLLMVEDVFLSWFKGVMFCKINH